MVILRYAGVLAGAHHSAQGLVVEPADGQRRPGHVEAGDEFADFRVDGLDAGGLEPGRDFVPEHEEFLVAGGAKAVDEDGGLRRAFGALDEHTRDQEFGEALRR